MWLMLQQEKPEDFVIATGVTTTVRDFVRMAFSEAGIILEFEGEGIDEVAKVVVCLNPEYSLEPGQTVVAVDPQYFRPTEVELLLGDATKARVKMGWTPQHSVKDIVHDMMESDIKLFNRDRILLSNGLEIIKNDE